MKIKWIIALFFLSLIFLAPTFKVWGTALDINQESETSVSETEDIDDETSGESGEEFKDEDETKDEDQPKDEDEDGVGDERENAEERSLQVEFDEGSTQIEVQSTLKLGETKNKFEFSIEADHKMEFEFEFKNESASSESEISMKFEFRRLVEFVDNTSNPDNIADGLDSNDTEIQVIDFHDLIWSIYLDKQITGSETVYKIVTNAFEGAMLIEFSFYISSAYLLVEGDSTLLQPSSVKFNVEISNFPFIEADSNLGVEVKMKHETENETDEEIEDETEDEVEGISEADEQQIGYVNSSIDAFFSWIKFYDADGVNKTVVVSPVIDDDEDESSKRKMYFNFVQGTKLFWDPKVGVSRATTSQYTPGANNTGTAIGFEFIVLLLIPIVGVLRKRNKST